MKNYITGGFGFSLVGKEDASCSVFAVSVSEAWDVSEASTLSALLALLLPFVILSLHFLGWQGRFPQAPQALLDHAHRRRGRGLPGGRECRLRLNWQVSGGR